ncbi:MAG: gluconate 2-dehydrogenase subunit 3 family protein [Saprospiraceae bacterium]|nr:gluconate 2-dehydrogenase subunit 3 family protein [Saprospiraceae bacterium]
MDRRKALRKTGLLAGASVVLPTFLALLQSCKTESPLEYQPQFFDADEARFISALIDTILPRTDTPGALDVKADIFMDKVFAQIYDAAAQQKIRSEMAAFNELCKNKYGKVFSKLGETERTAVLQEAEVTSGKFNGSVWGTAVGKQEPVGFYRSIKSMALWAYFSSEEIGKNVLSYDPIPQEFKGCIPLADVGNSWSL